MLVTRALTDPRGLDGAVTMSDEAVALLAAAPVTDTLDQMIAATQRRLRQLDGTALRHRSAREGYELLDEMGRIRLAVEGGANPNAQLMAEVLVGKVQDLLGALPPDGNIRAS